MKRLRVASLGLATAAFPLLIADAQDAKLLWSVRADADQPPFTQLGMAFVSGATVLLADNDVMQILRVDSTGKVTQRFGGKGGGPGEFRSISWMGSGPGDSIYVWDNGLRRLTVFTPAGTFVRTEVPEQALRSPIVFGRMANGHWLVITRTERELRTNGVDLTQAILHVGTTPTIRQAPLNVTEVPSGRHFGVKTGDLTEFRELPGMDIAYFAACDNGFLVGVGAAREVRAYDRNGKLMHTVPVTREPLIFTGDSRTAMIENWAGVRPRPGERPTDPKAAAAFAKAFDAAMPKAVTFIEQFSIGADRSLWLAPGKDVTGWQRLGNDGVGKPTLELAKGAWPVSISSRFVLAKWYGDDERVELWQRPKSTSEPAQSMLSFLGTCRTTLIQ